MAHQRSIVCRLASFLTVLVGLSTHSAARFATVKNLDAADIRSGPFAVDLMQYHHVDSPVGRSNLTLEERIEIALQSSLARGKYFHDMIFRETPQLSDKTVYQSPVYSGQGGYIMQIKLGTPAKTFVALADTGSDLVWIQCATCQKCFSQPDPIFAPNSSSSYKTLPCTNNAYCAFTAGYTSQPCSTARTCLYTYSYGDQSTTAGDLASETITLNTTSGTSQAIPNFIFGCGHNQKVDFGNVDGLVGLGQGLISLVVQLGSNFGNVFSYCLVDFYAARTKTSLLLLGSPGPVALQYTPIVPNSVNPNYYYVNLTGITINGVALQYPAAAFQISSNGLGGLILDSGTTLTLMDSRAYQPFKNRLQSLITYQMVNGSGIGFDLCYRIAGVANPTFPTVVFQFQGVNVTLPWKNVFLQVDNAGDVCLAFQSSSLGISIYGNVAQQNFQIAYDRSNKRIGFASKTC